MLFVLCDVYTKTNYVFLTKPALQYPLKFFYPNGTVQNETYFETISLLPTHFVQSKRHGPFLECISYGQQPLMFPFMNHHQPSFEQVGPPQAINTPPRYCPALLHKTFTQ